MIVQTPDVAVISLSASETGWRLRVIVDVAYGFRELRPHRTQCHYRDCLHREEPGCVVRDALERGEVSASRYESYLRILGSVERGEG